MEGEANQTQQTTPCKTGCGFYGNQASDGLCSKCYKDAVKQSQSSAQAASRSSPATSSRSLTQTPDLATLNQKDAAVALENLSSKPSVHQPEPDAVTPDETATTTVESPDKGKKKNRCNVCRKKVGLTGFICRCHGLFCGLHRYSDKHECTFDYKADAREQIAKQNPVVVGEKVRKI